MNVLFCIKAMDNPGGGAERVLAEVASGLRARGENVELLSFDDLGGESFYPLHPAIRRIRLGCRLGDEESKPFRLLRQGLILRRVIRGLAPDVVVGFMHSAYIPLGFALAGTGIPVIASEHIVPEHYRSRPVQAALLRASPSVVRRITCVSEQARQAFPESLRKKMVVVPNPISLSRACRPADVVGEDGARRTLLAVGRLDAQKDHATLIDAFAMIADDFPDWDLRILGDGELRGKLKARITAKGLERRIALPGSIKDIAREYERAQLFVQPSRYESYGLTVVEALGHGLPAVGFDDCIGVNELIRPGENGLLVSGAGNRARALAEGLRTLMADARRRACLAATDSARFAGHGIEQVLDRWQDLLRAEAGRRPQA